MMERELTHARRLAIVVLVLSVAACATRTAGVEQRLILPEGAARYEMAANQAFVFPAPRDNAPPGFPQGYELRDLPPTTLCAGFVVDTDGGVREIALLEDPGCMGPKMQPQLGDAVLRAISGWRFEPAVFCDYPDAATRDRDWNGTGCAGAVTEARRVAVTLAYAFTFEVRNGRQQVGAAQRKH
ncbi:hypothetical protein CSC65_13910 [Pseudoxanthomonas daejeonensis]|uniref:Lipoprotein n=2 Tax=Pseudoxanthomonas daejeonensis TaxID=266062 RepID=A0ABQ6Z448_9GAMM|nr:hypothetical protein CSC65_13910 [Pseudoxanthomonas daejeonensis]